MLNHPYFIMYFKLKTTSIMRKIFLFIVPLLFCVFSINAQNKNAEENAAFSLVSASKATLALSAEDLGNVMVSSTSYDDASRIRMVYLIQTYMGVPVFNQMLVLAFRDGKLLSQAGAFNHSLQKFATGKTGMPAVAAAAAVQSALSDRGLYASQMAIALNTKDNGRKVEFSNMGVSRENITAQLMWTPVENSNEINLSWHVYIIPKATSDYWMVRVDAVNNSILGLDNYTDYDNWGTPDINGSVKYPEFVFSNMKINTDEKSFLDFKKTDDPSVVTTASYRVVPFPAEAPSFSNGAHGLRTDPWLAAAGNATTLKWNTGAAATDYAYSRGNNVWAYEDRTAPLNIGTVAKSANSTTALPNLTFDFTPDYTVNPTQTTPVPNQQFNITNLFYWNNVIHDIMYIYGFTEAAANFQADNLGRGGLGNDHVNAEAQDIGGTNNANFSTPADGGSGRMQMYLWNGGTPNRDGDVDNGIVVHEYGHGISNRLTGGGTAGCLGNAEQMGEGWSDYYGLMFTQDWATATLTTGFNSPRGIGTYALFQPTTGLGIRTQRYCTDFAINNKVYLASLPAGPHPRGEIWCAALWDMTWNIINQVGTINPNLYNFAGGGGNAIAMKLVTEGLKLQQCGPGFISGRNAILQADQNLYGGLYNCAIWEAFRRRGMGAFASEGSAGSVTDQVPDFTPPLTLGAIVSAPTIPEGFNLTYTNSLGTCSAVTGYTLRDTLPTNVTHVSGGTYDAPNRVVSFTVNQAAGTTNYPFIVNVNPGSYFPPVTLFTEPVATASIPATWTTAAPAGTPWSVSTTVSNSAPNSFFVQNLAISGDQRLTRTAAFALPLNSYPELSFWHRWNTEDGWDGGVVEISNNGGTTWNDAGAANFTLNGYNGGLGAAPTNALSGRAAFTGLQSTFINTKINLSSYNGQSIMLRFRFGSDDNTTAPTAPEGWWVDDITLSYKAAVNMRSNLFNAANTRVAFKDMVTEITQVVNCNPTINQQPVDVTTCAGSSVSYTCVGAATGGVSYQWQISTTGIAGAYTNLANGAPYSGVTTSTLTVNPTTVAMNGNYFRCVVTGGCAPTATSNPSGLFVAAGSTAGTVTPANSNVCGTTNSGTLTVAGFNGNVVRWESATNIAGPWTPIAVTTATYIFNNITQTTYFRAVTQFGTCAPASSSLATVTFTAATALSIVADPGTTVCAGDPTRLTVSEPVGPIVTANPASPTAGGNGQALVTFNVQNNNVSPYTFTSITSRCMNSGAMNARIFYKISAIAGLPGAITAANGWIQFGAGASVSTAGGVHTLLSGLSLVIPAGNTYGIALEGLTTGNAANIAYTNGTTLVTYTNNGVSIITGGNAAYGGAAAPAAPAFNPRNFNGTVTLTGQGLAPVTTGTYLWTPAAGLSSTTTNPVAASPATTTTYTVSHNNGAGCIRQASITITVNQRPVVTTQPINTASCSGSTATFTVAGTGSGLTYQWQVSTTGCAGPWSNLVDGTPYSGTLTATLTVNPTSGSMNGYAYRAVLGGPCAAIATANISNCAVLTVNPLPIVTITPAGPVCGGVAGIFGTQLSTASAPTPIPGSCSTASGAISVAVPDNTANGVTSTLAVSCVPANATITGIRVNFNMPAHTYVGDMLMNLKAPNGTVLNLVKYMTGTATQAGTYPNSGFVNTTISSSGTTALGTATTTPITGTWRADLINGTIPFAIQEIAGFPSTATNWNQLYSTPNGTWTLAMADGGPADVGTLTNWSITVEYTTPGTTSTPLTYTWSPATGLYTNAQATIPYVAGTQTPVVFAAPTVATVYTATGTNGTTGCIGSSTILVNYTPPAPVVTPNPVAMCLGDIPVKLRATSTGAPAVWTPAAGLFSDAAGTTAYVAGTSVDSVWTRPATAGVYSYQVTAQNSLNVLATPTSPLGGANTNAVILFNVRNNNLVPVTFTNISSNASASGAVTSTVYHKATPIAGAPGAITVANGWNQFGTGASTVTAGANNLLITGLTLVIPPNTTYGIALQMVGAGGPAYTNGVGTIQTYSNGGCDIITDGNVGWGGFAVPAAPLNNPRNFNGRVTLVASGAGTCTSPARTVTVTVNQPVVITRQPVNQSLCTDKVATFSVVATGTALSYQWQVSTTGIAGTYTNITNGGVYSGATTSILTITAPPTTMSGYYYRVVINGAAPCASATSNPVLLTVNPLPIITITPVLSSLFPGMTATLTATVIPNPAATFTWIRDGVQLTATSPGILSGIGTNALTVNVDGQGTYTVRVIDVNGCTSTSNSAVVKDSANGKCFIYPNPNGGKFQVRYYSVASNTPLPRGIVVYDSKGDRVLFQNYTIGRPYDRMDVDMRAYGKGLYWVEIVDRNGNRLTMCRVVIQ